MASPFNDFTPLKNGVAEEAGVLDYSVYYGGSDEPRTWLQTIAMLLMVAIFVVIFAYGGMFG